MRQALHISQARKLMDSGERFNLSYVRAKNGIVMDAIDVVSLSYDIYSGTRTIKFLRSGQLRTIRDCLIIGINNQDVYL